jgi:gas vesicle protein
MQDRHTPIQPGIALLLCCQLEAQVRAEEQAERAISDLKGVTAMDDDSKFSYFFLGLGLGVAVGVLFAPKSGAETRALLRDKAEEGADYVKKTGVDLKDQATEAFERGKSQVQRHKENLSAAVEAGRAAYRDAINNPLADS